MTEVVPPVAPVATNTITTTTIETEPVAVSSVQVEEINGVNGTEKTNGTATNGIKKTKKPKAEPEPPKDPKDPKETIAWLKAQKKPAVHKVNYEVLSWVNDRLEEPKRQSLPGSQDKVTRGEFLGFLKNGTVLAHLANKLSPGSVETVHEGEAAADKANQVINVQSFLNFVKEKVALAEDQVFSVEDLQEKGKEGFDAVFNTLFHLGLQAKEKFDEVSIDAERIVEEAKNASIFNFGAIVNKLKGVFTSNKQVAQAEEKAAEPTSVPNGTANGTSKVIEVEEQVNMTEVVPAPPSAVAVAEPQTNFAATVPAN